MRWGLLSTAMINQDVAAAAKDSDEAEIVAIASRELAKAEAQVAELGAERAYGSYDELLADPDLEAIYVSVPNSMHVEWATRALDAGKHVLAEKTFAVAVMLADWAAATFATPSRPARMAAVRMVERMLSSLWGLDTRGSGVGFPVFRRPHAQPAYRAEIDLPIIFLTVWHETIQ